MLNGTFVKIPHSLLCMRQPKPQRSSRFSLSGFFAGAFWAGAAARQPGGLVGVPTGRAQPHPDQPRARAPRPPLPPRSLRPWKHYVPLPHGERSAGVILGLVDQLRADDRRAQHLAESAQKWAYRRAESAGIFGVEDRRGDGAQG